RPAVVEASRRRPFLGICIGLQMLFERSDEGGVAGLGLLAGTVRRFPESAMTDRQGWKLKVPHMGWNRVRQARRHPMWSGLQDGSHFYFVHSYFPCPAEEGLVQGTTEYGVPFTCAVARDNIFAVQFHPEKSAAAGLRLLANFLNWNP
ncbi:MAG TPA: imidazole glycerol phosphate synthase subunit HisH, partial [Burkholderiales bacterium]|nr:imidazole glycerol phosphate synthase subunit HisH [Burkholderiales bacterium]